MKISINWLKELVDLNIPVEELIHLLPLRSVSIKEVTPDFIELDMKGYNRTDLLSLRGVAQEIAAITDSKLKPDESTVKQVVRSGQDLAKTPVEIADEKLSSVQIVAKIENLKVEQSSDIWVKKLSDSGMRPVNNIVDVTNLVMLDYGQPLHSFDTDSVKDETIIVRLAKQGEEIVTLDGKLRRLDSSDIVLADTEKSLDVAGVMGSKDTEVTETTTTILLSASLFNPAMVQKTSTKLGLRSEASRRFQHGLTKIRLLQSIDAAIKMYEGLGGKLTALTIVGDLEDQVKKVTLTQKKLNLLIGVEIKPEDVETYLNKLGFKLASNTGGWNITIPYWRLDIELEEDLIEEVARMYGYEKIPAKELAGQIPPKVDQTLFNLLSSLKKSFVEAGLTEIQTYSFYSTAVLENLEWDKEKLVKIANPISSETEYLREDLWPNLLEVVAKNSRRGIKDIAIFEIGKVYSLGKNDPTESYRLSLTLCNGSDDPSPQLYQIFQNAVKSLGVKLVHPEGVQRGEYEEKYFHPTRFSFLEKDGKNVGGIAEVHPRFVNRFGIEKRVAVLEIDLESTA